MRIIAQQVDVWPEATYRVCGATATDPDGIGWTCTREAEHETGAHVAHYDDHTDGHVVIGLAWTDED